MIQHHRRLLFFFGFVFKSLLSLGNRQSGIVLFLLQCLGQALDFKLEAGFIVDARQIFGPAWTRYCTIGYPEQAMNDKREQDRQPLGTEDFPNTWLNQGDFNDPYFFLVLQGITNKNFTLTSFSQSASGQNLTIRIQDTDRGYTGVGGIAIGQKRQGNTVGGFKLCQAVSDQLTGHQLPLTGPVVIQLVSGCQYQ